MTMHHTDDTSSCGGVEAGTVGSSVNATVGSASNSGGGQSRTSGSNTSSNNNRRGLSRFSLRRLLYEGPLARLTNPSNEIISPRSKRRSVSGNASGKQEPKKGMSSASLEGSASVGGASSFHRVPSKTSIIPPMLPDEPIECQLCFIVRPLNEFAELSACQHRACKKCMQHYLRIEISESRVSITCPICFEFLHPNEIRMLVANEALYIKYEDFMVRKVLAAEADARWCPAPDCGYAVLAAGCASCPRLRCERPGCGAHFCYHCKAEWHPNQTCDAARAQRSLRAPSVSVSHDSHGQSDVKPCPRCKVYIVKMDDGSCNHMMCAVCGAEFCWLCMKEIRDLHYLSPSGCTFWGKKPWSRKKKILWQLGTLVGAPIGIALIAGIAVPAMIIGIPVWVGSKLYVRYTNHHKRNAAVIGGVTASILVAPVLAGLAVGIGVPILLFYVYGVVPVSLCRSGGCGVSTSASGGFRLEFDDENDLASQTSVASRNPDTTSMDRGGNLSIGEASLASSGAVPATGSHRLEVLADVTTAPLHHQQRHSLESETADDAASTRALAGSILGYKASESSSITTDDCSSERVRFDDNVSVIGSFNGASSSSRKREPVKEDVTRRPRSTASTTAVLRSLFFHSTDESTGQSPALPAIQEPSLGVSLCPDSIAIDVSTP